jgi:hypothetical protein
MTCGHLDPAMLDAEAARRRPCGYDERLTAGKRAALKTGSRQAQIKGSLRRPIAPYRQGSIHLSSPYLQNHADEDRQAKQSAHSAVTNGIGKNSKYFPKIIFQKLPEFSKTPFVMQLRRCNFRSIGVYRRHKT